MLDGRGRQKNAGRPDSPKRVDKKVREKRNPESCWAGAGGESGSGHGDSKIYFIIDASSDIYRLPSMMIPTNH